MPTRSWRLMALSLLLAACAGLPNPPAASPTPAVIVVTSAPGATSPPLPTALPTPSPTPVPIELVVCQTLEPLSLYLYGGDVTARASIFEALFDGPIDNLNFGAQPVILERLPSLENGGALVRDVEVRPGERVVDAETGAVVPLVEGVQLLQPDGSRLAYTGAEPARTVQIEASFSLRQDLRWSDGTPLTADDSVFSFEVASSPDTPGSKYILDRSLSYTAVDAFTVRWTGLPGWWDTEFALRFWTPLPRHAYGTLSARELLTDPDATGRPLGWGPFVLREWVRGSHLTLERNPNYFRAAEGLPRLDRVTFRFGLDGAALLAELRSGKCDLGLSSVGFSGQVPELKQAEAQGVLDLQAVPDPVFEHLDFGLLPAEDYKRAAGSGLFQDTRLRQALAHCLDRQAIIDQLLDGLSEVPAAYLPSTHPLYASGQLAEYAFDPARGQALLDEVGWMDLNGDGVREQAERSLSVRLISGPPESPFRQALLDLVAGQLRANCGMEVQTELLPVETLYAPWPAGPIFGRHFDLAIFPWRTGSLPPCELYLTEAIPGGDNPGGANLTGYSSPLFDQACQAAGRALDEAGRRAQHAQAQVIFSQDLPSLPLFWQPRLGLALPRVDGYRLDSTAPDLWNLESIGLRGP